MAFSSSIHCFHFLLIFLSIISPQNGQIESKMLETMAEEFGEDAAEMEKIDGILMEGNGRAGEKQQEASGEMPSMMMMEGSGEDEDVSAIEALLDAAKVDEEIEENNSTMKTTREDDNAIESTTLAFLALEERQKTEHCQPKLDLIFMLDSAGSIQQLFQEHVRWAVSLVESLPLEQDSVRVAAVQYAGFPLVEFANGLYPSKEDILQHNLQQLQSGGMARNGGYALRKAQSELFRKDRGARKDVQKVFVLFTDGLHVEDPLKVDRELRELNNVKIFIVSIGMDGMRPTELNRIGGDGGQEEEPNLFGPDDLQRLREALLTEAEKARACARIGDDAFMNGPRGNGLGGFVEENMLEHLDGNDGGGNWTNGGEDWEERRKHGRPMAEQIDEIPEADEVAGMLGMDEEEHQNEGDEAGEWKWRTATIGQKALTSVQNPEAESDDAIEAPNIPSSTLTTINSIDGQQQFSSATFLNPSKATTTTTTIHPTESTPTQSAGLFLDELEDVFEPVDGLPFSRAHPHANTKNIDDAIILSSSIRPPSTLSSIPPRRRIFPVRVELPRAFFTRRPAINPFGDAINIQPKLEQKNELRAFKEEFTGPNNSRRLMKSSAGAVTMRIITAAIATSTRPSNPANSANRKIYGKTTKNGTIGNKIGTTPIQIASTTNRHPKTTTRAQRVDRTTTLALDNASKSGTTTLQPPFTLTATTTKSTPRRRAFDAQTVVCPPVDLLFLLDSSGSVHRVYENQKNWLEQILEEIELGGEEGANGSNGIIGPNGAAADTNSNGHRVALVQFAGADLQKTEWEWDRFRRNGQMMDAFHQVRHLTGTTYIGHALQYAIRLLEERRRQVPTLVILLSDGFSQDDAVHLAKTIRKMANLQFFALSLGELSNTEYLHRLVDDPSHVFIGQLAGQNLRAQLLRRIRCG